MVSKRVSENNVKKHVKKVMQKMHHHAARGLGVPLRRNKIPGPDPGPDPQAQVHSPDKLRARSTGEQISSLH